MEVWLNAFNEVDQGLAARLRLVTDGSSSLFDEHWWTDSLVVARLLTQRMQETVDALNRMRPPVLFERFRCHFVGI